VAESPVTVTYAFAGLPVRDRDEAIRWYERLLGKPPDFLPHDGEAVWQLAATASLYVLMDTERAGHGFVTLVVDDLDATLAEISGRGITLAQIDEMPGAGRKCIITDPDGNEVGLVEIASSGTP
jgi:predicted enzyme related to lactoylglutathione lyase